MSDVNGDGRWVLPEGWVWTTLGEIANPTRERVQPQDYPHLPFIGMDDISSQTMQLLGTKAAGEMRSSAERFWPDDVLYGSLRPYLNKVYRPDFEGLASGEFIVFRSVPHLLSKYLQYFLNQWSFVEFINRQNTGDRPRVKFIQMADYPFPLAQLDDQHRIVAEIEKQFTRLDAAVAALRRAKANLARYKAAVLQAAVEGRLVAQTSEVSETSEVLLARILAERRAQWEAANPKKKYVEPKGPDVAGLPELPVGWVWATVEQVGQILGGLTQHHKRDAYPMQLPFLRVANVYANRLELDDIETIGILPSEVERVRLEKGDLLIVEGNGSIDQIGRVALWDGSISNCVHQNHIIKVRLFDKRIAAYVLYWLLSKGGREQITLVASSTSGLYTLSLSKVASLAIPLPPLSEQARITAEVDRRLSIYRAMEVAIDTALARADRLRQGVLGKAFRGELVANGETSEVSEDL